MAWEGGIASVPRLAARAIPSRALFHRCRQSPPVTRFSCALVHPEQLAWARPDPPCPRRPKEGGGHLQERDPHAVGEVRGRPRVVVPEPRLEGEVQRDGTRPRMAGGAGLRLQDAPRRGAIPRDPTLVSISLPGRRSRRRRWRACSISRPGSRWRSTARATSSWSAGGESENGSLSGLGSATGVVDRGDSVLPPRTARARVAHAAGSRLARGRG